MRDPVTLGVVDVDVRRQPAAQPAAQLLDPAAAESGHADRRPSLASPTRSMRAQTHPLSTDLYNSTAVPYTCISQCSQMSSHQIRRSPLGQISARSPVSSSRVRRSIPPTSLHFNRHWSLRITQDGRARTVAPRQGGVVATPPSPPGRLSHPARWPHRGGRYVTPAVGHNFLC
eukprot:COSAG01_NODE_779_length_13670_cov_10.504974_7_plen_173_part_00